MSKKIPSKLSYKIAYIIALIAGSISLLFCILAIIAKELLVGIVFAPFTTLLFALYHTYKKRWENYDAICNTSQKTKEEYINKSTIIDGNTDFSTIESKKSIATPKSPIPENFLSFKVAGVTFKTGRKSRQVMLKNMYFQNTPPFDEDIKITFERYDYEGELAIGVYANDLQIGNVPAKLVKEFDSSWTGDYLADFEVYGGGNKNWGCIINVTFY